MDLALHNRQAEVYRSPHRFRVVVAGRRSGKTHLARVIMIAKALGRKKQRIWYIAPTYQMARQIMWDELIDAIPKKLIKKVNNTLLIVRLINGSVIELKGADNPDTLRGVGLHFVVLDEAQDMKSDVWTKVIRPTLSSTAGEALIQGTPKGFNLLYELYRMGQIKANYDAGLWASWQFATRESPFIPASEIEAARRDMDAKSFRQEYEASFESMGGRVYYAFDRDIHVGNYPFNPALPIWVGQDFNIDPMSSVILQPQKNGEVWVVDELILPSSNTAETCDYLEQRYWRYMDQVTIYPDPAGGYRQHARGESDLKIFKERGFESLKYHKKHPPVTDRVNSVNAMLMNAEGKIRLRINDKCRKTIESLDKTIYKEGSRDIDKRAGDEHATDALGYPLEYEFPMNRRAVIIGYSH